MYHYISYKNKPIVDIEPWISNNEFKFVGGIVDENIPSFLDLYDSISSDKKDEFKEDFRKIGEARRVFYERILPLQFNNKATPENLKKTHEFLREWLTGVASKYNLNYDED